MCHEEVIPSYVEQSFTDLYQSAFSVLEYFKLHKTYDKLNALAIYTVNQDPRHVLAYSIRINEVTLLNELFDIEQFYLQYFVNFIFAKYPHVHTINLNRLKCKLDDRTLTSHTWCLSEDTVIQLPATISEYKSKLGKHTRANLNNYYNRLKRIYGDFTFTISGMNETDPTVISRIIEMNRLRMDSKKIKSGYDLTLENRIINFCQKYGYTTTITFNGKIVAGAIYYSVGNHCFLETISHDPEYNKDRVGQVCLYLTIKHTIEQGREAFHFLWGKNEYKYRLLGVQQDLYHISIYRSEFHKVLNFPKLLKYRLTFFIRQLDYWYRKYILKRFK